MHPILTRYGPFFLYSFTAVLSIGLVSGLGVTAWRARRWAANADWWDTFLAGLVAGLIGGRLGFIWLEWSYFQERPSEIFQIWRGGLTYHGALLAGLLGGWAWCRWRKRSFLRDADLLAPAMALVSAFGWLACWLDGCGYGREAPAGAFLAANLPDKLGIYAWRYQTQLLGVGLSLLVFAIVLTWSHRWLRGQAFYFVLLALSLGRVAIGFWRGDTAVLIGTLRLDILLDAVLAIVALILLQYSRRQKSKSSIIKHKSSIK
jgi:phosphatidylglycerol---prolipoprotein diacylglyceryl transferase